ncbi:MAG: DUF998 domain-containing protein [Actinomycetota bacterium]
MTSRARIVAGAGLLLSATCVAILHFLRTDLEPGAHRLSEYANGPYGWMMAVAFVALGCGLVALAVALWAERGQGSIYSWTVPGAALAAGVGAIVSGAFRTGISHASEVVHSRASALATVALVALALLYSLPAARRPGAVHTLGTGLALIASGLAAISPLLHETRWTGLSQRLLWIALLAWLLWVTRHRPPRWDGEASAP